MSDSANPATPEITERNTKPEILAAYERLRAQLEGRLPALPLEQQQTVLSGGGSGSGRAEGKTRG